jgi:hypothetical protein
MSLGRRGAQRPIGRPTSSRGGLPCESLESCEDKAARPFAPRAQRHRRETAIARKGAISAEGGKRRPFPRTREWAPSLAQERGASAGASARPTERAADGPLGRAQGAYCLSQPQKRMQGMRSAAMLRKAAEESPWPISQQKKLSEAPRKQWARKRQPSPLQA